MNSQRRTAPKVAGLFSLAGPFPWATRIAPAWRLRGPSRIQQGVFHKLRYGFSTHTTPREREHSDSAIHPTHFCADHFANMHATRRLHALSSDEHLTIAASTGRQRAGLEKTHGPKPLVDARFIAHQKSKAFREQSSKQKAANHRISLLALPREGCSIPPMRAAQLMSHGQPGKIEVREIASPKPTLNEVVVDVRACGLNHLDLWLEEAGCPSRCIATNARWRSRRHYCQNGRSVNQGPSVPAKSAWHIGDRVASNRICSAARCEFCQRGEESMCLRANYLASSRWRLCRKSGRSCIGSRSLPSRYLSRLRPR